MRDVNIQFHMLPTELYDFIEVSKKKMNLDIELERHYPHKKTTVTHREDLRIAIVGHGHVDRMWLIWTSQSRNKRDYWMLNVGEMKGVQLTQSQLGAKACNAEAYDVLKELAADLRQRTIGGLWCMTASGAVGYYKQFRVSPGAAEASRSGKIILVGLVESQLFYVNQPKLDS